MNAADTGFILICAAMVFVMTPAVALFYGGLVSARNVLSTSFHSYASLGLVTVIWAFVGYTLAFAPMAHWVWGGGWMAQMGAVDFAGGAVVHMASAAAALACAQAVGPRLRSGLTGRGPHNLPMTLIGGGLLWFGWFGFNAGSALSSGPLAAHAFATTHLATAFGVAGWLLVEWIRTGKPTSLGAVSGALAGLVVITPAAGYVPFGAAMFMGLVGGMGCYAGILLKYRFHYDDALDVVGIHGIGGTIGALLTGVFACASVNGVDGLLYGNPKQLLWQFIPWWPPGFTCTA